VEVNPRQLAKLEARMRESPANVAYNDLFKVCEHHFGQPRQQATSHAVFKMPWPGDPRVNIQNDKGKAKVYQVKQVLAAIEKLQALRRKGEGK
jgi:hypothetical protein